MVGSNQNLTAYGQGGTSEAAALVTGISSLLQERYDPLTAQLQRHQ